MDHELRTSFHYSSSVSCPIIDSDFLGDGSTINTLHQNTQYVSETTRGLMEGSDLIKAQIANHPLYPTLLSSYIDCRKVGATPEMASVLEEISKEKQHIFVSSEIGTDPELDHFMKSYGEALQKYKGELRKPFEEATNFLSSIGSQLTNLCKETLPSSTTFSTDSGGGCASDDEMSCGEVVEASGNGDGDLKEMLMKKYSGYLSSLRKDMLKKRKKGKLPKDAISALLEWWNTHFRWPYPTEEDKNRLSEMTGLDQKQINNWFINQRKRHWRPSEDMKFALMEGVGVGVGVGGSIYFDAAENARGDDNASTN